MHCRWAIATFRLGIAFLRLAQRLSVFFSVSVFLLPLRAFYTGLSPPLFFQTFLFSNSFLCLFCFSVFTWLSLFLSFSVFRLSTLPLVHLFFSLCFFLSFTWHPLHFRHPVLCSYVLFNGTPFLYILSSFSCLCHLFLLVFYVTFLFIILCLLRDFLILFKCSYLSLCSLRDFLFLCLCHLFPLCLS